MIPNNDYVLEIQMRIYEKDRGYAQGLEVRQSCQISAGGFLEIAKILGTIHDVINSIEEKQKAV